MPPIAVLPRGDRGTAGLAIIKRPIDKCRPMANRSSGRGRRRHSGLGRPRGRPAKDAASTDVQAELLAAARRLFAQRGFHEVSTRQIARAAGVNAAMIHYYFGDKEGLYRAMLETVFSRLVADVRTIAASSSAPSPIVAILELYAETLVRDPWIPRLMMREVLSDGAPFREEFIERFAAPASVLVPSVMQGEQQAQRLRDDLDPRLLTLSLMGMVLFPFLAYPVASRVFSIELNDDFRDRFVAHTKALFFEGAAPREERS
jgi:TetR/AcrR family transcriptional regulator